MSLWLTSSASAGASLSVARKYREVRIAGGASQDATFYLNSHAPQPRGGFVFKSTPICERMGVDRLFLDCVCSIETVIGRTSASFSATGATRFSGASASRYP